MEWEERKLTELAYYINGFAFKPEDWLKEGLPIVRIEQLKNPDGEYDYCNKNIPEYNIINNGDLIFSWSASLFLRIWQHGEAVLNQHLFKVVPFDGIHKMFLKYLLDYSLVELTKSAHGSTMQHITRKELEKFSVVIPKSETEQSKIAEILSSIDKAIDQTEAIIAKQQRIKNGLMQDLLTKGIDENGNLRSEETHEFKDSELGRVPKEWEIKSLSSLTSLISSGVTPRGGYKIYKKEGIPFIRSQNVYPFGIITEDIVFISDEIHESMPRTKVQNFDVLLNITGASIGRCCQVPKGFSESNVNQHVCIIRLNNNSEEYSKFIATFLASDFGQRQIFNQMAGGNREGLNFDEIGSFHVPEIDDKEAQRITNSIEKIEKTITALEQENNKLKRQKTGLMQDLLIGKVSVEDLI